MPAPPGRSRRPAGARRRAAGHRQVHAGRGARRPARLDRAAHRRACKELAGLRWDDSASAAFGEGLYASGPTAQTYGLLLERARTALERGESVVLDASWSSERWRTAARALAVDTVSDLVELRCTAPLDVAAARTVRRSAVGSGPSDADAEVARRMADLFDDWPQSVAVDTVGPPLEALARAAAAIGSGCKQGPPSLVETSSSDEHRW